MIDFEALARSDIRSAPFRFMAGSGVVSPAQAGDIRRDYPDIKKSGYLPLSELQAKGAFAELVADLQSPRLAEILSENLALDLKAKPRLITVRRWSKHGDGRVHNDSASKICTMLIYLNDGWAAGSEGAIRALNGPGSMDDYALEVAPLAGNVFAFARSETSWHGHPSYAGERFVVQTTFLQSEADLQRKENRGRMQTFLKTINPFAR